MGAGDGMLKLRCRGRVILSDSMTVGLTSWDGGSHRVVGFSRTSPSAVLPPRGGDSVCLGPIFQPPKILGSLENSIGVGICRGGIKDYPPSARSLAIQKARLSMVDVIG